MDEKSLQNFFKWSLGSLVVPAGLAAYGVPWPIIFAITLVLTVCVGVGAFPKYRTWFLLGVIATGVFALWTVKTEQGYELKWSFCRNQRYKIVDGEFRLFRYWAGVHWINDNRFDVWIKSDEQTLTLGRNTESDEHLSDPPVRIPARNSNFLASTKLTFDPPAKLLDVVSGRIRYVARYGRDPNKLDKRLIVSGRIMIEYPPDGDTVISFTPDMDSAVPATEEMCRVTAI